MRSCGSRSSSWRIAEAKSVVEFIGSSQAHWCFDCYLPPHPGPLPRGEGDRSPRLAMFSIPVARWVGLVFAVANIAGTMGRDDSWHETVRATAGRELAAAIRVGPRVRGAGWMGLARARGRGIQKPGVDHRPIHPQ